jgi:hypothetical protein
LHRGASKYSEPIGQGEGAPSRDAVIRGVDVGGGICGSNIYYPYKFGQSEAVPADRRILKIGRTRTEQVYCSPTWFSVEGSLGVLS